MSTINPSRVGGEPLQAEAVKTLPCVSMKCSPIKSRHFQLAFVLNGNWQTTEVCGSLELMYHYRGLTGEPASSNVGP